MNDLAVDARWLSTGIGTYTFNVLRRLKSCGSMRLVALTLPQHCARLEPFCDQVDVVDAGIYSLREQIQIPLAARHSRVLHVPHYNAPLLYNGTLLVSILDLTHVLDETFRKTVKSRFYARPMFHLASRKAAHVFTLSEYSKRQIQAVLGVPEEKITVTYCGVGTQFRPIGRELARAKMEEMFGLRDPYILCIGNLKPHKNIPTLLRAYAKVYKGEGIDQKLLIVGTDRVGGPALQDLANDLGIQEAVKFIPYVTDDMLPFAYAGADLLVFPSLEEGFGLPIIEAMACGTPVVCSNAASMPEVAGDAAVMFDPRSVDALADAITRVLGSVELQRQLREKGSAQAGRFDWQECAMRHYRVYESVSNG